MHRHMSKHKRTQPRNHERARTRNVHPPTRPQPQPQPQPHAYAHTDTQLRGVLAAQGARTKLTSVTDPWMHGIADGGTTTAYNAHRCWISRAELRKQMHRAVRCAVFGLPWRSYQSVSTINYAHSIVTGSNARAHARGTRAFFQWRRRDVRRDRGSCAPRLWSDVRISLRPRELA